MRRPVNAFAAAVIGLGSLLGLAAAPRAQDNPITAIDIALEPDATMVSHAEAANARLLEIYPQGYALDASHRPHITMLQRFVNTSDLDAVYAAVGEVLAGQDPAEWELTADRYDYVVWSGVGLANIQVKTTAELVAFQQKLIDAVAPFTAETGSAAAFFTTPDEPTVNQPTIDYVVHYVPAASGENLKPHVTIGVAPPDDLNKMMAEPFNAFTFSPAALSVYQVGNFGTARKELRSWDLKK